MSNPSKKKGTRGEVIIRDYLRKVLWSNCERTGSDHSTEWSTADLRETGDWSVEVKNHKNPFHAMGKAWQQALASSSPGHLPGRPGQAPVKRPIVITREQGRGPGDAIVLMRLGDFVDLYHGDAQ